MTMLIETDSLSIASHTIAMKYGELAGIGILEIAVPNLFEPLSMVTLRGMPRTPALELFIQCLGRALAI
ncbi:Uncharacterised protein [Mycobacteroides abscessus subsp. abscessus]|nr:Uncharacterised protein [Mycobacteroides abscessus subsp. abscessus]